MNAIPGGATDIGPENPEAPEKPKGTLSRLWSSLFGEDEPRLTQENQELVDNALNPPENPEGDDEPLIPKSMSALMILGGVGLASIPIYTWARKKMDEVPENDTDFPKYSLAAGLALAGLGVSSHFDLFEKLQKLKFKGVSLEDAKLAYDEAEKGNYEAARLAILRADSSEVNEFADKNKTIPIELLVDLEHRPYSEVLERNKTFRASVRRTVDDWFDLKLEGNFWGMHDWENGFRYASEEKALIEMLEAEVKREPQVETKDKTLGEVVTSIMQRNKRIDSLSESPSST